MAKTPEELAKEYALSLLESRILFKEEREEARRNFLAGYEAGYQEAKKYWANQPKYDVGTEEE